MSSVEALRELLAGADPERPVVVLTGAGVSAESGIPTFRGPEGYWSVGSEVYHPQEMATHAAFRRMPREVWRWYLYRWSVCRAAAPNPGHHALAELEQGLGERFWLITQNVDGLHLRAGNSAGRTLEIHGNIDYMRRASGGKERLPLPESIPPKGKDDPLTDAEWDALVFPDAAAADDARRAGGTPAALDASPAGQRLLSYALGSDHGRLRRVLGLGLSGRRA